MVDCNGSENKRMPLEGLRVLDLGWVWAVPLVGQMLADMGAEVIKVESHERLDMTRSGPAVGDRPADPDWAIAFHVFHRNKQGITLNLRTPQARELLQRLVKLSDVVIENMTPGTTARLGIDYETLSKYKPDLIMLSISSAGQSGPLKHMVSYSPVAGSLSGLETLVGYEGLETLGSQTAYLDPIAALYGVFSVLAALEYRRRTGTGQYIDTSLVETGVSLLAEPVMDYLFNSRVWEPQGNHERGMAPHNTFPCQGEDQWIAIAVRTQQEWEALCKVMGQPEWAKDERFTDEMGRYRHRRELEEKLAAWTIEHPREVITNRLQDAGVAAIPCFTLPEVMEDPHFQAREALVQLDHPTFPQETIPGIHWKLSGTPGAIRRHAPLLGGDNTYVFGDLLGLTQVEIEELAEKSILY